MFIFGLAAGLKKAPNEFEQTSISLSEDEQIQHLDRTKSTASNLFAEQQARELSPQTQSALQKAKIDLPQVAARFIIPTPQGVDYTEEQFLVHIRQQQLTGTITAEIEVLIRKSVAPIEDTIRGIELEVRASIDFANGLKGAALKKRSESAQLVKPHGPTAEMACQGEFIAGLARAKNMTEEEVWEKTGREITEFSLKAGYSSDSVLRIAKRLDKIYGTDVASQLTKEKLAPEPPQIQGQQRRIAMLYAQAFNRYVDELLKNRAAPAKPDMREEKKKELGVDDETSFVKTAVDTMVKDVKGAEKLIAKIQANQELSAREQESLNRFLLNAIEARMAHLSLTRLGYRGFGTLTKQS